MKKQHTLKWAPALMCLVAAFLFSCEKTKIEPVETYPDPPAALVKFLEGGPTPAIGSEGSIVTFNVAGLKGKQSSDFTFLINQVPAEVMEIGETTVKVKIPANACTGGTTIVINGEYYFGPTFTIRGKINIDPSFDPAAFRSNGPIYGIIPGVNYLLYGNFNNYQNQASETNKITNLAVINQNGGYITASQLKTGKLGINGPVTDVKLLPDGRYLLAGSFSKFDTIGNINNIIRLTSGGVLEMMDVDIINPDPNNADGGRTSVPALNGGVTGGAPVRIFYSTTYGYTMAGNFTGHISTFYERSTKDGPYLDLRKSRQILRMDETGAFDTTFNYDIAKESSYPGANGFILDAIELPGGKIILVGNFTTFNSNTVNYIAAIDPANGSLDPNFTSGGGADGPITRITYNATTRKILLTGSFKNYNGQPANNVVMLNEDGSRDASFEFKNIDEGIVTYAGQLKNGKILVSGSFNKYNNIVRPGLLVLNPDGSLAFNYNNTGLFRGMISGFVESISTTGVPQVMIVGNFDRFDGKEVGNIVKFRMEN